MRGPQQRGSQDLVVCGAVIAGLAVALGAFGAHALKGRMGLDAMGWWQTAVQYQMWHALGVLAIGLSGEVRLRLPALLFVSGVFVFCGTLYAMALGGPRWLGAVTPVGGLIMIVGWAVVALQAIRKQ